MKGFSKLVGFAAAAAIALGFAGCLSYSVDSVQVSIEGNADSVDAGKTVQFNFQVNASGKDTSQAQRVKWSVSSTSDGNGPVTPGTSVSPGGTLSVSIDEIYPILYVRAAHDSFAYSGKYDFKQINVKGPKVGSVILSTAATSVVAGGTVKLSAFVAGQAPNQGLTYSVGSKSDGTGAVAAGSAIAGDGTLTVAAAETASSLYVKAQSNSDATKSAIQEIKIVTVTSVTVSADGGTAKVKRGGSLKFSATVAGNNGPGQNVTWKVSANAAGTSAVTSGTAIAADGTLTVAVEEAAATLYVTATSAVDTTKSGTLAVVIPTVTAVAISPVNPQIKRGDGVTFTARVQGTGGPSQEVTWKLDGVGGTPSATTITSNGMLVVSTAETLSGLIVTATSVDDPAKFGTTMVTIPASPAAIVPATPVTPPPTTTVTPPATTPTVVTPTTPYNPSQYDSEDDFAAATDGNGVKIVNYKGTNAVVRIPGQIGGKTVLKLASNAFKGNKTITSVIIPEGVTTIEPNVFQNCEKLASVTFPSSLRSLSGFQFCDGLTSVVIPSGVTTIENVAFTGCHNLTSVTIPSTVTKIGSNAFGNCFSLTSVTIPNSVTQIDYQAFTRTGLTTVTIPNSVTSIGSSAFGYCQNLTSMTLGTGIRSLTGNMTEFCQKLNKVTFNGTIPSSGFADAAFYGDLKSVFYATDKSNGTPGTYVGVNAESNIFQRWKKQ